MHYEQCILTFHWGLILYEVFKVCFITLHSYFIELPTHFLYVNLHCITTVLRTKQPTPFS